MLPALGRDFLIAPPKPVSFVRRSETTASTSSNQEDQIGPTLCPKLFLRAKARHWGEGNIVTRCHVLSRRERPKRLPHITRALTYTVLT
jgi:hypothetical protein